MPSGAPSGSDLTYAAVVVEVEPPHLDRPFDYAVPPDLDVAVGSRVEVVFAGRRRRGLVVALRDQTDVDPERIRPLRRVFGPHVWMTPDEQEVARWAAARYGAPLADVVRHALPPRVVDVERRAAAAGWFPDGTAPPSSDPPPDPDRLATAWALYGPAGERLRTACADGAGAFYWRPSPAEDVAARLAELVQATLAGGRDVLVVVPDPSSPTGEAIAASAGDLAVDVRGGPSPRRIYGAWLRARCGQARVVVGERGVAFWPLRRLGLAIVVDEANPALKERRSPRHHAREVALERARRARAVGLLVGTVPSAPAWRLLGRRRLEPVVPERAAERASAPLVRVDTQAGGVRTRIGRAGLDALRRAVRADRYGVVLAARRGEGRALVCTTCGERAACPTCGSSLARHPGGPGLHCDGCGWHDPRTATCVGCGGRRLVPLAAGAEHIGAELSRTFDVPVAVLEGYAAAAPPPPAVLVMTRGSVLDAPPGPVGAVVLPDLDGQLRRPTLDAAEDALRLSMQLARWTVAGHATGTPGRRARDANVVVQTDEPDHHAVQALVRWDPGGFWRAEAPLRAALRFPPAADAIRLEVAGDGDEVAVELAGVLPRDDDVLGPLPRDGRSAFLIKSDDRVATVAALDGPRRRWSQAGAEVRLDVDPVDTT